MNKQPNIAVLLPCYNEAITIFNVISAFKHALPHATIYVYDNNSTDDTADVARQAGAVVRFEPLKGKGNVVRRMFADIEADVYLLADGDATYDANSAPKLVDTLLNEKLDMVVGTRVESATDQQTYRPGHRFGNKLFTRLIAMLFGRKFSDVFSGYRAFSKRFVKSFPGHSSGFDIETELTVHSLELRLPTKEIPTPYASRPDGSESKLRSFHDGFLISIRILLLLKETRPLFLFASIFLALITLAILIFIPVLITFIHTGLVTRLPTTILSTGMVLLAFISLASGIILDNVCNNRLQMKRFFYLAMPHLKTDENNT